MASALNRCVLSAIQLPISPSWDDDPIVNFGHGLGSQALITPRDMRDVTIHF